MAVSPKIVAFVCPKMINNFKFYNFPLKNNTVLCSITINCFLLNLDEKQIRWLAKVGLQKNKTDIIRIQ